MWCTTFAFHLWHSAAHSLVVGIGLRTLTALPGIVLLTLLLQR